MTDDATPENYYSDEQATFGDRVAAAREALALSQEDLAQRMGIKLKTVAAWEEDRAEPRANKLQMLSGVLNVSMRWLLTGEGGDLEQPGDLTIDAETGALLAEMRALRSEAALLGEKIGRLEKRLRASLKS